MFIVGQETDKWWSFKSGVFSKYNRSVRRSLFIIRVGTERLLLCTGGHAVFLRAPMLASVIKDAVDYKLLQHRNNCCLFLGIWHPSRGIKKVNWNKKACNAASWLKALWSRYESHIYGMFLIIYILIPPRGRTAVTLELRQSGLSTILWLDWTALTVPGGDCWRHTAEIHALKFDQLLLP